ncbi:pilin structural protein V10 [Oceanisphaera marina]|uniref:Pilin structural protein V10 n=1 Tax=Oceanisphaera marina TaxID=2017550 RepID=A0ABQ1IWP0_9GAMM|nr:type II secretion system protein [Oceanisphaera marina]GGB54106.1 pilin structural protein V10 [Oceanisphaera marina]
MRKSAGFTLIELVIVIVILGILGAVAAPKFLNLQGDAYGANLQAVKSSMESAATLINTKAILAGEDKKEDGDLTSEQSGTGAAMKLAYGYPTANEIVNTLEIKNTGNDAEYVATAADDDGSVLISPKARAEEVDGGNEAVSTCAVKYENAEEGKRPAITIDKSTC